MVKSSTMLFNHAKQMIPLLLSGWKHTDFGFSVYAICPGSAEPNVDLIDVLSRDLTTVFMLLSVFVCLF